MIAEEITPETQKKQAGETQLRELLVYLCRVSECDEAFSLDKLSCLLFLCDFSAYREQGRPITAAEYVKRNGVPAPRVIETLIAEMETGRELVLAQRTYRGRTQRKPVALREANLTGFDAAQIALADRVTRASWQMTMDEMQRATHSFPAWKLGGEQETIPYGVALLYHRELTEQEQTWAQGLDLSDLEELLA